MGAYADLDTAILGLKEGTVDSFVNSWNCKESAGISYGAPVFGYSGDNVNGYSAHIDTVVLTYSADYSASNSTVFTINGTALSAIVYADSNANTLALIKAGIEAAVSGSLVTTDAGAKTITIFTKGANLTATAATSGGSALTYTYASSSAQIFLGIAMFTQKSSVTATGGYILNEAMNVLCRGRINVYSSKAVNANTKGYVILAIGATQGQFTDSASTTFPVGVFFRGNTSGAGIVEIEVLDMKASS